VLLAFVDESGDRAITARSTDHFVLSAVVVDAAAHDSLSDLLARLRRDLGRRPGDTLHWRNVKGHAARLHLARTIGAQPWLTISAVVVCKRHLTGTLPSEEHAYLYTLRFLMERLSWLARDRRETLSFTLAHIVRFQLAKLRQYEAALRADPGCKIAWPALDPGGGRIDQPHRVEGLQIADAAASAIAAAFNADAFGNTEPRYLTEIAPRLYRRGRAPLTSYGLKMHPWSDATRAAYPWVTAL
jgi:hypothetical protein